MPGIQPLSNSEGPSVIQMRSLTPDKASVPPQVAAARAEHNARRADSFELSPQAKAALEAKPSAVTPDIAPDISADRLDFIASVRQQIENGTYLSEEKLEVAARKIAEELT